LQSMRQLAPAVSSSWFGFGRGLAFDLLVWM
jgi:hypothetical protein